MRVLVCGAGIQGSYLSARLLDADIDVTLLARGARFDEIQEYGMRYTLQPSASVLQAKVPVVSTIDSTDLYNLIIVAMQKQQAIRFSSSLIAHATHSTVLFLGNNGTGISDFENSVPPDNIVLGFLGVAGNREDDHIRVSVQDPPKVYLGAPLHTPSSRIEQVASLFRGIGFQPSIEKNIDAWLKCHLALVLPIVGAIYGADSDNYRLARTPGLLRLMWRGLKEAFKVIRKLGYPVVPRSLSLLSRMPEWMAMRFLHSRLGTLEAEISLAGHARAAREEMQHLASEFQVLVAESGLATPNIEMLNQYLDPGVPSVPDGAEQVPH